MNFEEPIYADLKIARATTVSYLLCMFSVPIVPGPYHVVSLAYLAHGWLMITCTKQLITGVSSLLFSFLVSLETTLFSIYFAVRGENMGLMWFVDYVPFMLTVALLLTSKTRNDPFPIEQRRIHHTTAIRSG